MLYPAELRGLLEILDEFSEARIFFSIYSNRSSDRHLRHSENLSKLAPAFRVGLPIVHPVRGQRRRLSLFEI